MQLLFRILHKPCSYSRHRHYCHRAFDDGAVKWVRDRGLDHAVEREKNLKPLLDIKNLIKSEPSKSLPISLISEQRDKLKIPFRPIEFIRKYPSVFQEFFPGNIGIQPHVKLTPEVLEIDAEEQLLYQSESYKQVIADRLLKLLMISRINKLPLKIIDVVKWDLGLPQDYAKSFVPEFPDCFRVVSSNKNNAEFPFGSEGIDELELVCWSDEFAVSVMEKNVVDGGKIVFSMKYSRDFEMDKKTKKWVDDWQRLPYISPYENATHLSAKSDESDKWAVAILHEVISLFGSKKAERDDLLSLGECLGIRSRFKRALLNHPGIFYVSSKNRTHTVVLREGYKRGLLIDSDPLMNIRSQYIHLMHLVKEDRKVDAVSGESKQEKETLVESKSGEGEEKEEQINDREDDNVDASDDDFVEEEGDDEEDDEGEEEEVNKHKRGARRSSSMSRGRKNRKMDLDMDDNSRSRRRGKSKEGFGKANEKASRKNARERGTQGENNIPRERGMRGENNGPRERGMRGENNVAQERGMRGENSVARERGMRGENNVVRERGMGGENNVARERGMRGENNVAKERGMRDGNNVRGNSGKRINFARGSKKSFLEGKAYVQ